MKNNRSSLLLVNQAVGPLFSDLIAAARSRCDVVLFKGISYKKSVWYLRVFTWAVFSFQFAFHLQSRKQK